MKITKTKLRKLIKEEMASLDYIPESEVQPINASALWQDLNLLLTKWEEKEHPYYLGLRKAMELHREKKEVAYKDKEDRWAARERGLEGRS